VDFPEDYGDKHFTASNPKFRPLDAYKLYFITDAKGYITVKEDFGRGELTLYRTRKLIFFWTTME